MKEVHLICVKGGIHIPLSLLYGLMKPYRHRRNGVSRSPQRVSDNHVLESTSVKGKIRGTARQLVERYLVFAEEARLANDCVAAEAFLQSAEHYTRLGNPVRHIDSRPIKEQPHASAPSATIARLFTANEDLTPPLTAMCADKAPAPEGGTVEIAPELNDITSREQTRIAKRAAAATDLERIAGQHGYTLAQLGLVLQVK